MQKLPDRTMDSVLHRSRWIVSGRRPTIEDGALLVCGGTIRAIGRFRDLSRAIPAGSRQIDHGSSALIPGLVNTHSHLEWSGLAGCIPLPQPGFPAWLNTLNQLRDVLPEAQKQTAVAAGRRLAGQGATVLCADTGTTLVASDRTPGDSSSSWCGADPTSHGVCQVRTFFEVLGFHETELKRVVPPRLTDSSALGSAQAPTLAAHAAYSTSAELIRQAKEWTRQRNLPFSIHAAEHREEIEFLRTGSGFFRDFLESIGRWNPDWEIPAASPIHYLDRLGVLDRRTILVHAVHMTEADWERVARSGCTVCFCPRSNAALQVGRPNLSAAMRHPIPLALGTDSLASNRDLNLFQEAAHVLDTYPEVPASRVFSMITEEGASALAMEKRFGTLEPGGSGHFLAVSLASSVPPNQLHETIIRQGASGKWQWTSTTASGSNSGKSAS